MTTTRYRVMDSPVGVLAIAGDDEITNLRMEEQTHEPSTRPEWVPDPAAFPQAVEQLTAYFAGELFEFDLPLRLEGTPFQRRVWAALQDIPYGETTSYGKLAAAIGQPTASRAVGMANGRNPVGIVVPCHRVIGAGGKLVGYGGGLPRKAKLLELEQLARAARYAAPSPT